MINKKITKFLVIIVGLILVTTGCLTTNNSGESTVNNTIKFIITDSNQTQFFDNKGNVIDEPGKGEAFYGQDAHYKGVQPSFSDNGDGTVTDNITGFIWQKTPPEDKMTYTEAMEYVKNLDIGGYTDWRLPTIKESMSIADLDGKLNAKDISLAVPYIDSDYFDFTYDPVKPYTGSYWTSTVCKMPARNDYELMEKNYGFNWADGHLKSYGDGYNVDGTTSNSQIPAGVRAVRGTENVYGINDFVDNNNGTITDRATGLMWSSQDSGAINDDATIRLESDSNFGNGRTWTDTLKWVEAVNNANYLGYSDWRLPEIKELQSIVQYGKTVLPATNDEFIKLSRPDSYLWSSTTCGDFPEMANYVAFGRGYGIDLIVSSKDGGPMGPPPGDDTDGKPMDAPEDMESSDSSNTEDVASTATIADFVDVHGPGCFRADYKDAEGYVTQAPLLSRTFWESLYNTNYPYPFDESNTTTEFDLSFSENAADYIVIYNHALLVRNP